jgi:hypothetical protein
MGSFATLRWPQPRRYRLVRRLLHPAPRLELETAQIRHLVCITSLISTCFAIPNARPPPLPLHRPDESCVPHIPSLFSSSTRPFRRRRTRRITTRNPSHAVGARLELAHQTLMQWIRPPDPKLAPSGGGARAMRRPAAALCKCSKLVPIPCTSIIHYGTRPSWSLLRTTFSHFTPVDPRTTISILVPTRDHRWRMR